MPDAVVTFFFSWPRISVRGLFIFCYTDSMIKIVGNDIMRGGAKIGWIEGNDIYNEDGGKVGYFSSNDIYDAGNRKLGYTEGNYLHTADGHKIELDDIRKGIAGGSLSDLARAAVRLLLGD